MNPTVYDFLEMCIEPDLQEVSIYDCDKDIQGGFSEEEFTLEEVYRSMAAKMETENPEPIAMVKFVYDKYAGLP